MNTLRMFALVLVLGLLSIACQGRPAEVVSSAPRRAEDGASVKEVPRERCVEDDRTRLVAEVVAAVVGHEGGTVDLRGGDPAVDCALRSRKLVSNPRDTTAGPRHSDIALVLDLDAEQVATFLEKRRQELRLVLAWIDETPDSFREYELHYVLPVGEKWAHVLSIADERDERARAAVLQRVAAKGWWPNVAGVEFLQTHPDGTADVRVLGYLMPDPDASPAEQGSRALMTASRYRSTMRLRMEGEARREVGAVATKLMASRDVFGPPRAHSRERLAPTLHYAVGTCGEWMNAAPVVLRGRLAMGESSYELTIDKLEEALSGSKWAAVRASYAQTMRDLVLAVNRAEPVQAVASVRRLRAAVQRAFGAATSLLELEVLLRRLEVTLAAGSLRAAREAFMDTRCTFSTEEVALHDAFVAHAKRVTR